jgi:hypothetical protein
MTLPDDLLGRILARAWADRPPRCASEELRAAAGLACMCRRTRALLRGRPLPLALNFSARRLRAAQRRWLLDRAQAGRIEAASFDCGDRDLWEQPALDSFLALHGGALLRLSGVPLRLVASVDEGQRPALDLSGLRLTRLGIDCRGCCSAVNLVRDDNTMAARMLLWPECLPGALVELELLGVYNDWLGHLAWAPHLGARLGGRLPRLRALRVTCVRAKETLSMEAVHLLEGFAVPPVLEVEAGGSGTDVGGYANMLDKVRSVRIAAGAYVFAWDDQGDVAAFVDRLCPAGLQAAELCAGDAVQLVAPVMGEGDDFAFEGITREAVRALISRHGDRFAVEVEVQVQSGSEWEDIGAPAYEERPVVRRLAWRRWPAPGAPGLPAARVAHERSRAWAAA